MCPKIRCDGYYAKKNLTLFGTKQGLRWRLDARTRRDGMGWHQDDNCLVRRQSGARTSYERIFAQDPGSLRPQKNRGQGRPRWDESQVPHTRMRRMRRGVGVRRSWGRRKKYGLTGVAWVEEEGAHGHGSTSSAPRRHGARTWRAPPPERSKWLEGGE
jgi:hypothetical protein